MLFAVPNKNPSLAELKISYDNWDILNKPSPDGKYIIVTLPGDAPDPDGKILQFSSSSSKKLFNDVKKLWQEKGQKHIILLQNSPRTGRFDINGQIICSHEYNYLESPSVAIDNVSKEFINWLKEEPNLNYRFFNFSIEINGDKRKTISSYYPLLYLAQKGKNNYFITPGESISMLSQTPSYISPNKNIVFLPDSMNESHESVFSLAEKRKYLSYFSNNGMIIEANSNNLRTENDAAILANDIKYMFFLHK